MKTMAVSLVAVSLMLSGCGSSKSDKTASGALIGGGLGAGSGAPISGQCSFLLKFRKD